LSRKAGGEFGGDGDFLHAEFPALRVWHDVESTRVREEGLVDDLMAETATKDFHFGVVVVRVCEGRGNGAGVSFLLGQVDKPSLPYQDVSFFGTWESRYTLTLQESTKLLHPLNVLIRARRAPRDNYCINPFEVPRIWQLALRDVVGRRFHLDLFLAGILFGVVLQEPLRSTVEKRLENLVKGTTQGGDWWWKNFAD
jgi:hypothetical protein